MRRAAVLFTLGLVGVTGCGSSDELDLADLSDRTVPAPTTGDEAGDGGGDDQSGGLQRELGRYVDACSVLTEAEVEAATGLVVIGSEDEPGLGCKWFVENIDPAITGDSAITFFPLPALQFEAQLRTSDGSIDGEQIPGLGDNAYYVGTETIGGVWVLLGDLTFEVGNQFAFTNVEGRPYQEALAAALADALR